MYHYLNRQNLRPRDNCLTQYMYILTCLIQVNYYNPGCILQIITSSQKYWTLEIIWTLRSGHSPWMCKSFYPDIPTKPYIFSPTKELYMSAPFCLLHLTSEKDKITCEWHRQYLTSLCSFLAYKVMIFNFYTKVDFNFGMGKGLLYFVFWDSSRVKEIFRIK